MKYLFYWFLDYVYVIRHYTSAVFVRGGPGRYRRPNARPIIMIPGVYEDWRFMRPIARLLYDHGYDVHLLTALKYNSGSIEDMTAIVTTYIGDNDLRNAVIVAHSKGGLVGKYALHLIGDDTVVRGLVAINTPFSGSKYAYILPFRKLRIFVPHSKILLQLADITNVNARVVSIYGAFDPHIPGGSKLEGAHNERIDTAYGHFRTLINPDVQTAVLAGIQQLSDSSVS